MFRSSHALLVPLVLCGMLGLSDSSIYQRFNRNYYKYHTNRNPKIYKELSKYESVDDQHNIKPAAINISLLINIDKALYNQYAQKYGRSARREVRRMSYAAVLEAEERFRAPSLVTRVHLDLLDVNFLTNNSKVVPMSPFGSDYLNAYCRWQSKKKTDDSMWFSILLTGLDLYHIDSKGKAVYKSEARSYRNGVCELNKSCAVVEGSSNNLAHVLTHEIGHSIGIRHDGDKNKCPRSGYIMASAFDRRRAPTAWSTCSSDYLRWFLMSKLSRCLKR